MRGYPTLAAFMAEHPEVAIIKRFSSLIQYRAIVDANETSAEPQRSKFSRDWYTLSTADDQDDANEQWKLTLRLREKLKEYNEAVLLHHQMATIPKPSRQTLDSFLEWKSRPTMGNVYLIGRDRNIWDERGDLAVLRVLPDNTALTHWLRPCIPTIFRTFGKRFWSQKENTINHDFGTNTAYYSDTALYKAAALFGTVIASLLPIAAIAILYVVHSMGSRLALLAVFTTIFSIAAWCLSDGRLIEIFASTSTFAAVQVVFIGTNIGTNTSTF